MPLPFYKCRAVAAVSVWMLSEGYPAATGPWGQLPLSEAEQVWLLKAEVLWGVPQNQLFSQGNIKTKTQQAKEMKKKKQTNKPKKQPNPHRTRKALGGY